jgi:DNA-binding ferritin-like protein
MTFDEYKEKVIDGVEGSEITQLDGVKQLGSSLDEYFVNILLFQTQLKIMHWGTESYSQHKAYMKTYDSISDLLDELVESYQGYHGRIDFGNNCEFISFSDVEPNSWLKSMLECLTTLRENFKESDLQNLIDELIASVSKLMYLLTLK